MADHYYVQPKHKRRTKRIIKKLLPVVAVLTLIIGVGVVFVMMTAPKDNQPQSSGVQTSVQGSSRFVFRTPYFQFQARDSWKEDAGSSKEGVYVYRAFRGPLIEQDLKIYVNTEPEETSVTRTMPVQLTEDGLLQPKGGISDHCKSVAPTNEKNDVTVTLDGVSMTCDPDGALYSVIVGQAKGDTNLELERPGGKTAKYVIVYRDLTANPLGRDMRGIVSSFQPR